MTLTNRVSAFFLGWLALALVGFAVATYLVVRAELNRRVDALLASTLDTLAAAADIDHEGVEWEGAERPLPRPSETDSSAVVWMVGVPGGPPLDQAGNSDVAIQLQDVMYEPPDSIPFLAFVEGPYRVSRRRLGNTDPPPPRPEWHKIEFRKKPEKVKYRALDLVAAAPLTPMKKELGRLAIWLASLTIGLWLVAALLGRWLCRRTLAPVAAMAASASTVGPSAPGERLTVKTTNDELAQLGRAFNGALDRLEEALDRQRRFTGDAAHQLRTPLAAMLGQVEVALRRDRTEFEYRETLQTVAGEVRHLHRLTESLLFLARADAEAARPELQEINLVEWVNARLENGRAQHPATRIEFANETSSPPIVRTHPELLAQLVDNLLDNAVKYGSAGAPVIVRIAVRRASIELSVEDSGPGIAAEDLPHIFDPFFRSADARKAGIRGVGLGLAISKRIATALGATLAAESEFGRSSRFFVRFPAPTIG